MGEGLGLRVIIIVTGQQLNIQIPAGTTYHYCQSPIVAEGTISGRSVVLRNFSQSRTPKTS